MTEVQRITGLARIAGVMGWPVSHSLSPVLHNTWLSEYKINGAYVPLRVQPDHLAEAIRALPHMGFAGANLTLPHKELVLPLLNSMDEVSKRIGAVNTVVVTPEGKLHGMNTDAYGFTQNISPVISGTRKAVILGAGGAARAVLYGLAELGFGHIIVVNRSQAKGEGVVQSYPMAHYLPWEQRHKSIEDADLLVNTTSLGMHGQEALNINLSALPTNAVVTDIVYNPLLTPLLQAAKTRGNVIVDGLGMLLYQAVPGFEAWFGQKPEVSAALRQRLLSALNEG